MQHFTVLKENLLSLLAWRLFEYFDTCCIETALYWKTLKHKKWNICHFLAVTLLSYQPELCFQKIIICYRKHQPKTDWGRQCRIMKDTINCYEFFVVKIINTTFVKHDIFHLKFTAFTIQMGLGGGLVKSWKLICKFRLNITCFCLKHLIYFWW